MSAQLLLSPQKFLTRVAHVPRKSEGRPWPTRLNNGRLNPTAFTTSFHHSTSRDGSHEHPQAPILKVFSVKCIRHTANPICSSISALALCDVPLDNDQAHAIGAGVSRVAYAGGVNSGPTISTISRSTQLESSSLLRDRLSIVHMAERTCVWYRCR